MQVFLVAKDFGAFPAYTFSLLHQERVQGIVTLGIPYHPPNLPVKYNEHLPEGFYISRWQVCRLCDSRYSRPLHGKVIIICFQFDIFELPIIGAWTGRS